jgi:hypothetical protein
VKIHVIEAGMDERDNGDVDGPQFDAVGISHLRFRSFLHLPPSLHLRFGIIVTSLFCHCSLAGPPHTAPHAYPLADPIIHSPIDGRTLPHTLEVAGSNLQPFRQWSVSDVPHTVRGHMEVLEAGRRK